MSQRSASFPSCKVQTVICECWAKSIPQNMIFSRGVTKNTSFIGFVTKINPKRPERSPNWTKWSQKGAKTEPKPPKWSPKGAKREPKGAQREPKGSQVEPKGCQTGAKGEQNAYKNRCSKKVAKKEPKSELKLCEN